MTAVAVSRRTRRRLIERGLDVLTWLVLVVMISPVLWLVASSMQTDGNLARGTYDLLHPTFTAFSDMWTTVEFSR
jgi:multiple sugar transport system permease protein